jgi:four helix bundle protein
MVRQFEEIEVWQLSRAIVKSIYTVTRDEKLRKNYSLVDQFQRAALSIMNNISEGFERQSDKEFIRFLVIAKGSAGEVRSMLYVLQDLELIDNVYYKKLHAEILTISKSLSGFISYLKNKLKL